jgi:hypothetical protein
MLKIFLILSIKILEIYQYCTFHSMLKFVLKISVIGFIHHYVLDFDSLHLSGLDSIFDHIAILKDIGDQLRINK